MSVRPDRPALGARYDRRRQEVLDAAAAVFASRGYSETSVQALADELGIAAGGIYHYFGSKRELLTAICDEVMHPLLEDARALADSAQDPQAELRELLRLWVTQVIARRDHMLVFQQQRHTIDSSPAWAGVRRDRKAFEQLVAHVIARVQDEGLLRGDRRLAVAALLGIVNHVAQWYRPRGPLNPHEIADGFYDLIVAVSPRAREPRLRSGG